MAFSSPAAMAQAQRAAEAQSMKALQDRREQTRKDFFKGRQDVSNNRLDQRQIQKDLYEAFKNDPKKTKKVAENLYQAARPGGKTLAQYNQELATKYGPTLSEIGGDIRYGLGNLVSKIADAAMQGKLGFTGAVKGVWDKVRDYFGKGSQTQAQGIETQIPQPSSNMKDYFSSMGINNTTPIFNNQYFADASQSDIDRINKMRQLKSMDPQSIYDMKDVFQLSPELTLDEIQKIKEGTITQPTGIYAENIMPSLVDLYNATRNPQLNTSYGNLRLDNVLSGNPKLGYYNTVDMFGQPVDLNATIGNQGVNLGATFTFNKGGSVNKYSGLGYMLK